MTPGVEKSREKPSHCSIRSLWGTLCQPLLRRRGTKVQGEERLPAARRNVSRAGIDRRVAHLVDRPNQLCTYSNATRGTIDAAIKTAYTGV